MKLIDVNVHLHRWPTRRLPLDDASKLVAKLTRLDVRSAWAGSFEALLHRDLAGVNQRLVEQCRKQAEGTLIPFGSSQAAGLAGGSHAPFFYPEAAILKLRESELPRFQQQALRWENARQLLESV